MNKIKNIALLILFAGLFGLTFTACEKDETFDPEDAKTELLNAGDEIMGNMALMMGSPPMESLMFLMGLMDMDIILFKSFMGSVAQEPHLVATPGLNQLMHISREVVSAKQDDFFDNGVYEYNFDYGGFLPVPGTGNVPYIQFIYPATPEAYAAQQLNGSLTIENLEFQVVVIDGDTEIIPSRADITKTIDDQVVLTLNLQFTYNEQGMPVNGSISMNMPPYSMNMTFSSSNQDFSTTMNLSQNGTVLISADLTGTYTPDNEYLQLIQGDFQITPLLFKGKIYPENLDNCDYDDVQCMNNNIDVELWQSKKNKKIGDIEFRMYQDPDWDYEYPELVVVYSDGTYDFLMELFDIEFDF